MQRVTALGLLVVLLLPVLGALQADAKQPLRTDLEHAITIFQGPTRLYTHIVNGQAVERNVMLEVAVPPEDIQAFCRVANHVYVIVEYSNLDTIRGRIPQLQLELLGVRRYPARSLSIGGSWEHLTELPKVEWVVRCSDIQRATGLKIWLRFDLGGLNLTTINDWGGVNIERVLIAPPQPVTEPMTEQRMGQGKAGDADSMMLAAAAGGAFLLGMAIMYFTSRRR